MFAELVLLFGLALNVFGNMFITSIADMYLSYMRHYRLPNAHQYVLRQGQKFYPDVVARDRFKIYTLSLIAQFIYFVVLNALTLLISELVAVKSAAAGLDDNDSTMVYALWLIGAGLGFVTILFDAASLIRLYVAFVMLRSEGMTPSRQSNLELISEQNVIEATFYEEGHYNENNNNNRPPSPVENNIDLQGELDNEERF
jgi:hypothetical protein